MCARKWQKRNPSSWSRSYQQLCKSWPYILPYPPQYLLQRERLLSSEWSTLATKNSASATTPRPSSKRATCAVQRSSGGQKTPQTIWHKGDREILSETKFCLLKIVFYSLFQGVHRVSRSRLSLSQPNLWWFFSKAKQVEQEITCIYLRSQGSISVKGRGQFFIPKIVIKNTYIYQYHTSYIVGLYSGILS